MLLGLLWWRSLGGEGLELGSGVQISKLALGLLLRSRVLRGPILKFERPTPLAVRDPVCCAIGWPTRPTSTTWPTNRNAFEIGVW